MLHHHHNHHYHHQLTARGPLPFAFAYQLYATLLNLVPNLSPSLKVTSAAVACPVCCRYKVDVKLARLSDSVECHICAGRPSFSVVGLSVWSSDEHSVEDALAMARAEVAKESAAAKSAVQLAHTKLVR